MQSSKDNAKAAATAEAVAAIANSKAVARLAGAVEGLVQLPLRALALIEARPERIRAIAAAKQERALSDARTEAEIERIRAETADFVFDREMRKTLNRQAILAEAQKALPPPSAPVSDEPISKDFVHTFFDEFDGIQRSRRS